MRGVAWRGMAWRARSCSCSCLYLSEFCTAEPKKHRWSVVLIFLEPCRPIDLFEGLAHGFRESVFVRLHPHALTIWRCVGAGVVVGGGGGCGCVNGGRGGGKGWLSFSCLGQVICLPVGLPLASGLPVINIRSVLVAVTRHRGCYGRVRHQVTRAGSECDQRYLWWHPWRHLWLRHIGDNPVVFNIRLLLFVLLLLLPPLLLLSKLLKLLLLLLFVISGSQLCLLLPRLLLLGISVALVLTAATDVICQLSA